MSVFADSSALVKLYADEDGHELIRGLPTPLVVSALAQVEVTAAIWRKHRAESLDLDDALLLLRAFRADYGKSLSTSPRFTVISVTDAILGRGAELAGEHGLRAYDSVQLASALAVREVSGDCDTLAAFDRALVRAALAEGMKVVEGASSYLDK